MEPTEVEGFTGNWLFWDSSDSRQFGGGGGGCEGSLQQFYNILPIPYFGNTGTLAAPFCATGGGGGRAEGLRIAGLAEASGFTSFGTVSDGPAVGGGGF